RRRFDVTGERDPPVPGHGRCGVPRRETRPGCRRPRRGAARSKRDAAESAACRRLQRDRSPDRDRRARDAADRRDRDVGLFQAGHGECAARQTAGAIRMEVLIYLVPLALMLGLLGLGAFLWTLKSGQYDDLDGAGWRAIMDDED